MDINCECMVYSSIVTSPCETGNEISKAPLVFFE